MHNMKRRLIGVAAFGLILAASASFAQQPQTVRVRGTVEAVDGPIRGDAPHAEGTGNPGVQEKVQAVCQRIADLTRRQLARVTVADLAK